MLDVSLEFAQALLVVHKKVHYHVDTEPNEEFTYDDYSKPKKAHGIIEKEVKL